MFNIKNVTWLKIYDSFVNDPLKLRGKDFDVISNDSSNNILKNDAPNYDTTQWNPVLYAIYYQRTDIVKMLMEHYVINFTLAIRLPPPNEFTEYIIPG